MTTTCLTRGGTSQDSNDAHLTALQTATDPSTLLAACAALLAARGVRAPWALPDLVPLSEFVQSHLARKAKKVAPSTLAKIRHALTAFQRFNRGLNLQEIKGDHCQRWADSLEASGLASGTITVMAGAVHAMFARAVSLGFLRSNPAADVELPENQSVVERLPLEKADIDRLIAFCRAENLPDWETAIWLGISCGCRLGDASRMDSQSVKIEGEMTLLCFTPAKTRHPAEIPVFGEAAAHFRGLSLRLGPLCPSLASLSVSCLSRAFLSLMERAGVDPVTKALPNGRVCHRRSYHSLRHSLCTDLARRGVPESVARRISAHQTSRSHGKYLHLSGADTYRQVEGFMR